MGSAWVVFALKELSLRSKSNNDNDNVNENDNENENVNENDRSARRDASMSEASLKNVNENYFDVEN